MFAKLVSAEEAAALIQDGATITVSGIGGTMYPRILDEAPVGLHQDWTGQPFLPKVDMVLTPTPSYGPQLAWQRQRQ